MMTNILAPVFKKLGKTLSWFAALVFVLMMVFGFLALPTEKKAEIAVQNSASNSEVATNSSEIKSEIVKSEEGIVSRVVDGDTLEVTVGDKLMKIRVIGINTPETVDPRKSVECFGQQASAEAKKMLLNQKVYLEKDSTQGEKDKYDRYLRFVWLESNNVDYGKQMIVNGFAFEYTYGTPYKYQLEYKLAQQSAEADKKGLWADDACAVVATPKPTPSPKPTSAPSSSVNNGNSSGKSCSGPDLDCGDFSTHTQAQAFFDGCGFTATNDPMKLDGTGVGDGIACESLP
jgi:micrococcal nuclease